MISVSFIARVLLAAILYLAPQIGSGQSSASPFPNQAGESMPLSTALKKVSDLFNTQFVYEKSLLEGKTTFFSLEAIKGKKLEEVLKNILYPKGLIFLYVKENYYSIVTKDHLNKSLERDQIIKGSVADSVALPQPYFSGINNFTHFMIDRWNSGIWSVAATRVLDQWVNKFLPGNDKLFT